VLEDQCRVGDDGRQFAVGPSDIAPHQSRVVGVRARERLNDVTDPLGKLSQDLLRFGLRRRVHARLLSQVGSNDDKIGAILKLSIRNPTPYLWRKLD
jgi:hypothetical protein